MHPELHTCLRKDHRYQSVSQTQEPYHHTSVRPTTKHQDEEAEECYLQVEKLIKDTQRKDILIIKGDSNAKIGPGAQGSHCEKQKIILKTTSAQETTEKNLFCRAPSQNGTA